MTFRPMLAAALPNNASPAFPVIASPKIDGIRTLIHPDLGPVTRSLKPIPNNHVRRLLTDPYLVGLDGELVIGPKNATDVFSKTASGVMSRDGIPMSFAYHVFDDFVYPEIEYAARLERVIGRVTTVKFFYVQVLPSRILANTVELEEYERECLADGYEGVMLRAPGAPYKYGRSTLKEGGLLKVKRFEDAEATVTYVLELKRNMNELKADALGYADRSSSKDGLVGADTLGALVVRHPTFGEFKIGSGFTAEQRAALWADRAALVGRSVTFKFQNNGIVTAPRFPIFKAFRPEE
jgi:DNA ligase-1